MRIATHHKLPPTQPNGLNFTITRVIGQLDHLDMVEGAFTFWMPLFSSYI